MQNEITTMFPTGDVGVCPKPARAYPNPKSLNEKQFFQGLKFSGNVSRIIFYHLLSLMKNLMKQSRENDQKLLFWRQIAQ